MDEEEATQEVIYFLILTFNLSKVGTIEYQGFFNVHYVRTFHSFLN